MAGKSDVLLKFDAEDAALIQKLMNVRSELLKTGGHAEEMGGKFGEAGKLGKEMAEGIVEELGIVTSAAAAAAAGVKMLIEAYDTFRERKEHGANTFFDVQQRFSDSMAASGSQGEMNDVRSLIAQQSRNGVNGQLFSQQQIMDQFVGVNNAVPSGTPVKDVWEATQVALKAQTAGINGPELGVDYARLKHMGVGNTENAATGLAIYGKDVDFWQVLEQSKDKDQMIRIIEAAGQVDEGKKSLRGMLQAANGDPARLQHFIDHPNSAPEPYRLGAANIARGMKDIGPVTLDKLVQKYQSDPFNQELLRKKQAEGFAQDIVDSEGPGYASEQNIESERRSIYVKTHPVKSLWVPDVIQRNIAGPEEIEAISKGLDRNGGQKLDDEQVYEILRSINESLNHATTVQEDMRDHLSAIRDSNPMLKNDVPGQH